MIGDPPQATIISGDALSAALIDRLPRRDLTLIFFDPPYRMVEDARQGPKLWAQMTRLAAVSAPDAMMILRCAGGASVPEVEGWSASARYDYGGMSLYHLLRAP
jgi:16S rRNA G966 N2-methylase RsmD